MRQAPLLVVLGVLGLLPGLAGCSGSRRATPAPPAPTASAAPSRAPARATGGGIAFEGKDVPLEQVLARSRATGRPAMLYFATTWCGYCRKLESETLPSPEVGRHMAGYYNVEYGADAGVGKTLAARYGVRGFPTLVRIDAAGERLAIYEGFDLPADFVRRIPAP
jgi:thiol-disulfide isomerase/thioredoxin